MRQERIIIGKSPTAGLMGSDASAERAIEGMKREKLNRIKILEKLQENQGCLNNVDELELFNLKKLESRGFRIE